MTRYLMEGFEHSKTAVLNLSLRIYLMLQLVICMTLKIPLTRNMQNIFNIPAKY